MGILLVVTEQREFLSADRARGYELIRQRLEQVAATTVTSRHYLDIGKLDDYEALVLSGSSAPWAAHDPARLESFAGAVRAFDGPVLGICAGMQLQAMFVGGVVGHAPAIVATGFAPVKVVEEAGLFRGLPPQITVYHRHTDEITTLPDEFRVVARSVSCAVEAIADPARRWFGTQFHPEEFSPAHPDGERVLRNFFESVS